MQSSLVRTLIAIYRLTVSPWIHWLSGPAGGCRFLPTCSQYAEEAFQKHGYWQGTRLSLLRISRCHPFSHAGYDPVPHVIAKSCFNFNSQHGR